LLSWALLIGTISILFTAFAKGIYGCSYFFPLCASIQNGIALAVNNIFSCVGCGCGCLMSLSMSGIWLCLIQLVRVPVDRDHRFRSNVITQSSGT